MRPCKCGLHGCVCGSDSARARYELAVADKAPCSGVYKISVSLFGLQLPGSPFRARVITPAPVPSRSLVSGAALTHAVARHTEHFEVRFRDALGQVAIAEEVDVWLQPVAGRHGGERDASERDATAHGSAPSGAPAPAAKAAVAIAGAVALSAPAASTSDVGSDRKAVSTGCGDAAAGVARTATGAAASTSTYAQAQVEVDTRTLLARASCELDSAVVGQFVQGQLLRILAEEPAGVDGCVRALVEGVRMSPPRTVETSRAVATAALATLHEVGVDDPAPPLPSQAGAPLRAAGEWAHSASTGTILNPVLACTSGTTADGAAAAAAVAAGLSSSPSADYVASALSQAVEISAAAVPANPRSSSAPQAQRGGRSGHGSGATIGESGHRSGGGLAIRRLRLDQVSPSSATEDTGAHASRAHQPVPSQRGVASPSHRGATPSQQRAASTSPSHRGAIPSQRAASTSPSHRGATPSQRGASTSPPSVPTTGAGVRNRSRRPHLQPATPHQPEPHNLVTGWVTLSKDGVDLVRRRDRLDPAQRQLQRSQFARRQRTDRVFAAAAGAAKDSSEGASSKLARLKRWEPSAKGARSPFLQELESSPRGIGERPLVCVCVCVCVCVRACVW